MEFEFKMKIDDSDPQLSNIPYRKLKLAVREIVSIIEDDDGDESEKIHDIIDFFRDELGIEINRAAQ